jgi:hypothetical protein
MKTNQSHWTVPLTGALLLGTGISASAQQDQYTWTDANDRLTLSLRYGLNIHSKFSGVGNNFAPGYYLDGYVIPDDFSTIGYTYDWGYNVASQYNPAAANSFPPNTISFHQVSSTPSPADTTSMGAKPYPGVELSYDREFIKKEDWHNLRIGLEAAANYMKISMKDNSSYVGVPASTTGYQLAPDTTAPPAGYQGSFDGGGNPGTTLEYPGTPGSGTTTSVVMQDHFDADLWGGRLGPYVDLPLSKSFDLRLSGGLAVGFLNGRESWQETIMPPLGGNPVSSSGGGRNSRVLWGYFVGLTASWQMGQHWGLDGAVQFQDIGKYNHSFQGRSVELDLNRSLFVELGVSYSF